MDRLDVLRDLVAFNKPVRDLSDLLGKFGWDYEGQSLTIVASQIQDVLKRFLAGEYSVQDLEDWANLIECREDLEFEEKRHDEIADVIYRLANPALEGKITSECCEALLDALTR